MATKKQKREAALAKREAYMAEVKAQGLRALEADRARQEADRAHWVDEAEEINARHRRILSRHGIKPGTEVAYGEETK